MSTTHDARRTAPGAASRGDFTYSVVLAPPTLRPGAERRGGRRVPTRLHEGTVGDNGRVVVHCRIRDRSGEGARLHLEADRPLPRRFVLTDMALGRHYRVALVWQSGREAGVRIVPLRP